MLICHTIETNRNESNEKALRYGRECLIESGYFFCSSLTFLVLSYTRKVCKGFKKEDEK